MKILTIYSGHNSSASLFIDNGLKTCVSEERFSGIKNQSGYPEKSINYIFTENIICASDLDYVAIPYTTLSPLNIINETNPTGKSVYIFIYFLISKLRKLAGILGYYFHPLRVINAKIYSFLTYTIGIISYKKECKYISKKLGVPIEKIKGFDHHLVHAAAAYSTSRMFPKKTLVLTLDGEGDGISASVNIFEKGTYQTLATTSRDNSPGLIYMYLTGYLGMKMLEHEYKVMGLAPYAKDQSVCKLYKKIENILSVNKDKLTFTTSFPASQTMIYLIKQLKGERFDNIAGAFQKLIEDKVTDWIKACIAKTGIHDVCLSGGVFMNVKLNKHILELEEVKELYILPSCADESLVLGCNYLCQVNKGSTNVRPLENLYLGPQFSNEEVKRFIEVFNIEFEYNVTHYKNIEEEIAKLLASNNVVARMSGKMEFGARALGNRSILANPSDMDVVMEINEQMKDRDFWMPFAPSILREREKDYILNNKSGDSRFMIMAFDSTPLAKKELRAGLHPYDFTCRPQVVDQKTNPKYHKIIKEFEKLTGIGGVLNTSFNLHGFPIVLGPKEAMHAFENSGLKYLALENYLITKK